MPTLIEVLEEIAGAEPVISISAAEVNSLVRRFGDRVRRMGRWNVSSDGSLDIPVGVVREAAKELNSKMLLDALAEIKTESLTQMLDSSAALLLIDKISEAYEHHFREIMSCYQEATSPGEATELRDELVRDIFGE